MSASNVNTASSEQTDETDGRWRARGMALGVLVGALTLGKASPYLVNAVGSADWRYNMLAISALAVLGGLIVLLFVGDGPYAQASAPFDFAQVTNVFRNRGVRL